MIRYPISDTAYIAGSLVALGGVCLSHFLPEFGWSAPSWLVIVLAVVFMASGAAMLVRAMWIEDERRGARADAGCIAPGVPAYNDCG